LQQAGLEGDDYISAHLQPIVPQIHCGIDELRSVFRRPTHRRTVTKQIVHAIGAKELGPVFRFIEPAQNIENGLGLVGDKVRVRDSNTF